jgi:hypothetical protein
MPAAAVAPPAVKPTIAHYFVASAKRSISYAEAAVKDIPAGTFAHMPHANMNHPAFCIGHLSLYPNRIFSLIGQPKLVVDKPGYPELFAAGVQCVEQDGRYPAKDEIVAYFLERSHAMLKVVEAVPDDVFARENPLEGRIKEVFPLVGNAVNFMLNNHNMMHLGQISAWRRAMGMGSVM